LTVEQDDSISQSRAKSRDPLVGTTLDGRFEIEEVIGSGGMSVVYKATQLRVNRHVAIKTLRLQLDTKPVYRERFQREINLLSTLSHPNIVTVYDCLIGADDQPYVVMDYLRGSSLEKLIKDGGALSPERCVRIAVQICSALDHAHRRGVIHRDVKPGNIVLMDNEMDFVKVVDFGLAKLNQDNRRLTQSGELWGSPPYMSPEQAQGKPEDERSDIYSFGAVLYEMLTGKDPFHYAISVFELIQTHVKSTPPTIAEANPAVSIPPKLEQVVFKALAKDPADRFQTAAEMLNAIVEATAGMRSGESGDLLLLADSGTYCKD
jgi:eukaryotic-like serine/threonine-protein kinase